MTPEPIYTFTQSQVQGAAVIGGAAVVLLMILAYAVGWMEARKKQDKMESELRAELQAHRQVRAVWDEAARRAGQIR